MALSDLSAIQDFLRKRKATYVTTARERPSDGSLMLYVPKELVGEKVTGELTSLRQLQNLKKAIQRKFGYKAEVIFFTDDTHQVIEAGLFKSLNQKFNGAVVSIFLSFSQPLKVRVFIEVASLDEELQNEVGQFLVETLSKTDIVVEAIDWLDSPLALPSPLAMLRMLKTCQPISLEALLSILQADFPAVSDEWLRHRLDYLRKKQLVLRQQDKTYVLSGLALRVTPAGTRRASSDIDRALALGRRKW